ncbi:hypothetical protein FDUTEX481_03255 [Tolypothrix sp. PCC 7601]|nr:hypothetical protein FDUTEX481_03255 [Tolypothrix sp. PCC 7601]
MRKQRINSRSPLAITNYQLPITNYQLPITKPLTKAFELQ